MQNLYLTLLTATLAIFGLWYATLFFYVNQLTAKYSIRDLSFLLRDIWTIFFILTGIFSWLLSTLGAFTLLTPWFPIVLLITFFIFGVLFIVLTYRYSTYLNAQLLLGKVFSRIKLEDVKRYVFHFYDVPEPIEGDFLTPELKHLLFRQKVKKEKLSEEKKREYEKEIVIFQSRLEEYNDFKKEVNELRKKCKINDPFSTVVDISAKALRNHDHITWRLIHDNLHKLIEELLNSGVFGESIVREDIKRQSWDPYVYLSKLLVQHFSFMKEVVITSGHPSLLLDVISTAKHLANSFASLSTNWKAVLKVTAFLKKLGKELIDDGKIDELHPIFDSFGELGEQSIEQNNQESFDEICRSFGWLGEHLVMKSIPVGPLIPNYDATGELDSLINCIDRIKNALIKEKLEMFSQTYYSAIEVITLKFIEKGDEKQTFELPLISIIRSISECGEEAAKLGISSIVSYSVDWLRKIYEYTKDVRWFKELPQDIVNWMSGIGALAACNNRPITDSREASLLFFKPASGKEDLIEVVIQEMGSINDQQRMECAMHDIYGKYPREDCDKAVSEFITRMGKVCKSNFGFMFDWETGETYPANDPRRK